MVKSSKKKNNSIRLGLRARLGLRVRLRLGLRVRLGLRLLGRLRVRLGLCSPRVD